VRGANRAGRRFARSARRSNMRHELIDTIQSANRSARSELGEAYRSGAIRVSGRAFG